MSLSIFTTNGTTEIEHSQKLHPSLEHGKAYLDALPYIDGEIDPEMREHVDRLILEEMQNPRFPTRNYLADLPVPQVTFEKSFFIRTELERVAAGKPMAPFDESRYAGKKPDPQLQGDLQAWRAALNNLRAQQEHLGNRVVNMELLQSFAPDVWLLYNRELEAFKGRLDKELEGLRKEAELINLSRKTKQDELAPRLANLTRKRDETMYTNLELQKACAMLRSEIKRLKVEVDAHEERAGVGREQDEGEEEEHEDL
ncbi:pre-mrna-splicing factor spf27 homolog [Nannochloropsis oceanica]